MSKSRCSSTSRRPSSRSSHAPSHRNNISACHHTVISARSYHLDELAVLYHHGVDDSKECLVRWEEGRATSEGVALHHALASVLRQNLNNTTAIAAGSNVPLEVTTGGIEDSVELVRHQFIGREDTE